MPKKHVTMKNIKFCEVLNSKNQWQKIETNNASLEEIWEVYSKAIEQSGAWKAIRMIENSNGHREIIKTHYSSNTGCHDPQWPNVWRKDIADQFLHQGATPLVLRTMEECVGHLWQVTHLAVSEIERLRKENRELKKRVRELENIKA